MTLIGRNKRSWSPLPLAILLAAAWPAGGAAQTANIQKQVDKGLQRTRIYEDIEIIRRLMMRRLHDFAQSCQQCHQNPFGAAPGIGAADSGIGMMMGGGYPGMSGGPAGGAGGAVGMSPPMGGPAPDPAESIVVEGAYLPGQGVVLQVQAPNALALQVPHAAEKDKPMAAPSEWELIRKQLRGEKVSRPSRAPHVHQTLPDVITKLLAENGKHLRLEDKEALTIAITFRGGSAAAAGPTSDPFGGMAGSADALGGGIPMFPGASGGGSLPGVLVDFSQSALGMGPGGSGTPSTGPGGRANTSKDHELLADFHLKQGQYKNAVESLLRSISLNTDANRIRGLQRKLAIAYLMVDQYQNGDPEAAAQALQALQKANEGKQPSGSPPARQASLKLPERLIVTASRSALQIGEPDDLRAMLVVEWLRFNKSNE